jgi:hypothetical protein
MLDSTTLATVVLLASASALLLAAMLYPSALLRWFQRKRYQYEVTFSLYMLTSTEKFIFSTCLHILLAPETRNTQTPDSKPKPPLPPLSAIPTPTRDSS